MSNCYCHPGRAGGPPLDVSNAIKDVDFVVALLSKNACNSRWVTKELNLAINKEIAGKKVSVLPIMVKRCELPSFLNDKIYANLTRPSRFDAELDRLLSSLGVKREIRDGVRKQKQIMSPATGLSWVQELAVAKRENDPQAVLRALGDATNGVSNVAFTDGKIIDLVASVAGATYPLEIRILAIRALGSIPDARLWEVLQPFLDETDERIVTGTIDSLSRQGGAEAGPRIYTLMTSSSNKEITHACLNYFRHESAFARVRFNEFQAFCERLCEQADSDPDLATRAASAFVRSALIRRDLDGIRIFLSKHLLNGHSAVREGVLLTLIWTDFEKPYEAKTRYDLQTGIEACFEDVSDKVRTHAFCAALALEEYFSDAAFREVVWSKLLTQEKWVISDVMNYITINDMSERMNNLRDIEALASFLGRFDKGIDSEVGEILGEIGTIKTTTILAAHRVDIDRYYSWKVIQTLFLFDALTEELIDYYYIIRNHFDKPDDPYSPELMLALVDLRICLYREVSVAEFRGATAQVVAAWNSRKDKSGERDFLRIAVGRLIEESGERDATPMRKILDELTR
jgi:TIR domain